MVFGGYYIRQLHRFEIMQSRSPNLWLIGGLTAGAAIDIHLFAMPLVLAVVYACFSLGDTSRKTKARDLWLFAIGLALLVVPYLYGLLHAPAQLVDAHATESSFRFSRLLTGFRAVVVHWSDWLSIAGFLRYFATGKESILIQEALKSSTGIADLFFGLTLALQSVLACFGLYAFVQTLRMRSWYLSGMQMRLIYFAGVGVLAHLALAVSVDATQHLHYFQAVWWMPLVIAALWWDRFAPFRWQQIAKGAVILLVAVNVTSQFALVRFWSKSKGYDTPQLGATLQLQRDIVETLCQSTAEKQILLNRVNPDVSRSMMQWLGHHSSSCKDVTFADPAKGAEVIAQYVSEPAPHIVWDRK